MFTKEQVAQLKELNDRLQNSGFSWQYSDYFLLQEVLPSILLILSENSLPPNTALHSDSEGRAKTLARIISEAYRIPE